MMMILPSTRCGLAALVGLCSLGLSAWSAPSVDRVVDWVRADPAATFDRLEIKDEAGQRGTFATAPIAEGEVLYSIPWRLVVDGKGDLCLTVWKLLAMMRGGDEARAAYLDSVPDFSPEAYTLPMLWPSDDDFALVRDLPPYDWRRHEDWWEASCGGNPNDQAQLRALAHTITRAVADLVVPLFDLTNHAHEESNIDLVIEPGVHAEAVATRAIPAGAELKKTYGAGVTHLFRDYGFVESRPRLWNGLPGGHAFWVRDDSDPQNAGTCNTTTATAVEWTSTPPTVDTFDAHLGPLLNETARTLARPPQGHFAQLAFDYNRALHDDLLAARAHLTAPLTERC